MSVCWSWQTSALSPADRQDGRAAARLVSPTKGDVTPAGEKLCEIPAAIDWHLFWRHQWQERGLTPFFFPNLDSRMARIRPTGDRGEDDSSFDRVKILH
jgi:hypothetical protein